MTIFSYDPCVIGVSVASSVTFTMIAKNYKTSEYHRNEIPKIYTAFGMIYGCIVTDLIINQISKFIGNDFIIPVLVTGVTIKAIYDNI